MMETKERACCAQCLFATKVNTTQWQCRRYPPTCTPLLVPVSPAGKVQIGNAPNISVSMITGWPVMGADDFCYEWQPIKKQAENIQ